MACLVAGSSLHAPLSYFHFHLKLSAGTFFPQPVARIHTIHFTSSTAPCEPAVGSPVFIEVAINNTNLQGPLTHIHPVFSGEGKWIKSASEGLRHLSSHPFAFSSVWFGSSFRQRMQTTKIASQREGEGRGGEKGRGGKETHKASFAFHC